MDNPSHGRMSRRQIALAAAGAATAFATPSFAQIAPSARAAARARPRTPGPPVSAAELAAFDAAEETPPISLNAFSAADRKAASDAAAVMQAVYVKALLNRLDPAQYPLAASPPGSLQASIVTSVAGFSPRAMQRARGKLAGLQQRRANVRGLSPMVQGLDFRQPDIVQSLAASPLAARLKLALPPPEPPPPPSPPKPPGPGKPKYHRATLSLASIRCLQETAGGGWGSDEIVLGGLMIGASGHAKAFPGLYAHTFDSPSDGETSYRSYGDYYLGQFNLDTTNGYPKDLWVILQLVESDSDGEETVKDVFNACADVAKAAAALFFTSGVGVAVGFAVAIVSSIIDAVCDDDPFVPYGLHLRLNSENEFGADGVSGVKKTGIITSDDGGRYRIAYRWSLAA